MKKINISILLAAMLFTTPTFGSFPKGEDIPPSSLKRKDLLEATDEAELSEGTEVAEKKARTEDIKPEDEGNLFGVLLLPEGDLFNTSAHLNTGQGFGFSDSPFEFGADMFRDLETQSPHNVSQHDNPIALQERLPAVKRPMVPAGKRPGAEDANSSPRMAPMGVGARKEPLVARKKIRTLKIKIPRPKSSVLKTAKEHNEGSHLYTLTSDPLQHLVFFCNPADCVSLAHTSSSLRTFVLRFATRLFVFPQEIPASLREHLSSDTITGLEYESISTPHERIKLFKAVQYARFDEFKNTIKSQREYSKLEWGTKRKNDDSTLVVLDKLAAYYPEEIAAIEEHRGELFFDMRLRFPEAFKWIYKLTRCSPAQIECIADNLVWYTENVVSTENSHHQKHLKTALGALIKLHRTIDSERLLATLTYLNEAEINILAPGTREPQKLFNVYYEASDEHREVFQDHSLVIRDTQAVLSLLKLDPWELDSTLDYIYQLYDVEYGNWSKRRNWFSLLNALHKTSDGVRRVLLSLNERYVEPNSLRTTISFIKKNKQAFKAYKLNAYMPEGRSMKGIQ